MSNNDYNPEHWKKKLPKYLEEAWSKVPSPFVQMASKYFEPHSKVLELGTGAGQDGIWLESQNFDVTLTDGDAVAFDEIIKRSTKGTRPLKMDITKRLPFKDQTFDVVYAQLVLHYFDDKTMNKIMSEIKRVLKPGGILACMVNSTNDPEYDERLEDSSGLINVDGLFKRYFSVESFSPLVQGFDPILFDNRGRTPKDDAVQTSGMIQFIGRLKK